jgi:hypothetical protein
MKRYLKSRLFMLLAMTLLATASTAQPPTENPDPNGGGGGAGSCVTCYVSQQGQSMTMSCGGVASGEWGHQFCRVESYPEGSYCFVDGNACCVD